VLTDKFGASVWDSLSPAVCCAALARSLAAWATFPARVPALFSELPALLVALEASPAAPPEPPPPAELNGVERLPFPEPFPLAVPSTPPSAPLAEEILD